MWQIKVADPAEYDESKTVDPHCLSRLFNFKKNINNRKRSFNETNEPVF